MSDAFDNASMYGGSDDEELIHHNWADYVWDVLTSRDDDDRFGEPVEVTAYQRMPVDEGVRYAARRWAEEVAIGDYGFEEHVSPEYPLLDTEAEEELRQGLQAVLARVMRLRAHVWGCEPVATRTLSPAELRELWELNGGE